MVNSMVERATSDMLIGPDWAMNIEICDMLNHDPCSLEFFKKQLCKNWLGSCSDEHSWKKSRDLLEKVGRQGDLTGYRVSCLLIGAKDDLTPYPRAVQDSVKVK
ncbi:hypothetical protein AAZX31_19G155800 [Glycine max]